MYPVLQHLQNAINPNIFNPQIVYNGLNRYIQFLQHLQNAIDPTIFNPWIVSSISAQKMHLNSI